MSRSSVAVCLLGLFCASACSNEGAPSPRPGERRTAHLAPPLRERADLPVVAGPRTAFNPRLLRRFKPARELIASNTNPVTEAKSELGRMLYFDPRLSLASDLSCNSCHDLARYGVDGRATSLGHEGSRGTRNAPTVYHAAAAIAQFWDGRAETVEEQAMYPLLNPREMAMPSAAAVVARLERIPGYVLAFEQAFPETRPAITFEHVTQAIGAFERRLTTRSRWDAYLDGDGAALSPLEIEGLKLFTNEGCLVCHTGELLGGNSFQKSGVALPWPDQSDPGRYTVTGDPADRMHFKVPTLRNVAMTAPYFHDGSAQTLPEAVRVMARYQLGSELGADDVNAIVAWLATLTGPLPSAYIQPPTLPPGAQATGAP